MAECALPVKTSPNYTNEVRKFPRGVCRCDTSFEEDFNWPGRLRATRGAHQPLEALWGPAPVSVLRTGRRLCTSAAVVWSIDVG